LLVNVLFFFFQAEDGIRDDLVTGVQTCALPISGVVEADGPRLQRLGSRRLRGLLVDAREAVDGDDAVLVLDRVEAVQVENRPESDIPRNVIDAGADGSCHALGRQNRMTAVVA